MPRPHNKEDLLKAAQENYEALMSLIDGLTEKELNTPFDFSGQPNKKEAHWSRDKNVRDVFIFMNGISFCWIFQRTTKARPTRNPSSHFYQPTIQGRLTVQ